MTNRREFLAGMAGLMAAPRTERETEIRYPWSNRADELRESEGVFADLVAWHEWSVAFCEREADYAVDTLTEDYAAYLLCCEAVEQAKGGAT